MNLPSLPTDSMYKFLAIFGLAIFLFSYIEAERILKNDLSIAESYKNDGAILEIKSRFLEERVKQSLDETKYLEELINNPNISKGVTEELRTKNQSIKNLIDYYENELKTLEIETAKFSNKSYISDMMKADATIVKILLYGTSTLGLVVMIVGFNLWYYKLQKYIDASVRKRAEKE